MIRLFWLLAVLVLPLIAVAQPTFVEGVDYRELEVGQKTDNESVEVIEFFRYGCPACNAFEAQINAWQKNRKPSDVSFTQVPAIFHSSQMVPAKAFYSAQALGVLDIAHAAIFDAIHRQKKPYKTPKQLASMVAARGVDQEKFMDAMSSFDVDAKVRRARQMARHYKLPSVPALIVNGRYLVTGGMAQGFARMLDITDYLIQLEKDRLTKSNAQTD